MKFLLRPTRTREWSSSHAAVDFKVLEPRMYSPGQGAVPHCQLEMRVGFIRLTVGTTRTTC